MSIALGSVLANRDQWTDGQRLHYVRRLTFSGNYITGGDTLNLNVTAIKSRTVPYWVDINGRAVNKYLYNFIPGANTGVCKVQVTDSTTGLELANGPYPAEILNDVVTMYAITLAMQ